MWVKEIQSLSEGFVETSADSQLSSELATEKSGKKIKPAKRLFQAMLYHAIVDFAAGVKNPKHNEDYRTAKKWLFKDDYTSKGPSLAEVCEILDLEVSRIRSEALKAARARDCRRAY